MSDGFSAPIAAVSSTSPVGIAMAGQDWHKLGELLACSHPRLGALLNQAYKEAPLGPRKDPPSNGSYRNPQHN